MSRLTHLVLLLLISISLADRDSDFVKECLKNNDIDEEQMGHLNPDTDKYLCYTKCIYTKKGVLDLEGNIQFDKILELFGPYKPDKEELEDFTECLEEIKVIKKCKDIEKVVQCFESNL